MPNKCAYCGSYPTFLGYIELDYTDPVKVYAEISGSYLTLFDNAYPGTIEDIPINYCPMCGRKLREEERNAKKKI